MLLKGMVAFCVFSLPVFAQGVSQVSFCPAGFEPDGFINWTNLPRNPPIKTFNVPVPVSGVNNLSVGFGIFEDPPLADPLEGLYTVVNPAVLTIPFGAGPVTFIFSRPVRGVSLEIQTAGRLGHDFQMSAFRSQEDLIGNLPAAQVTSQGSDDPAKQFSTSPLQIRSTSANLAAVAVRFTGDSNGEYGSYNLVNVRVESGSGPDPSRAVPADGLREWLRSDRVNAQFQFANLGSVISWPDQSGNGSDAVPPNPSQAPAYSLGGPNCTPVVSFGGGTRLGFNLPIAGWTGMTVFLVARSNTDVSDPGANQALFWSEHARWGATFFTPSQSNVFFRFGTTQVNNQPVYHRPQSVAADLTLTTAIHNNNTDSLYVNGVRVLIHGGKLPAIAGTVSQALIGAGLNNTFFTGDITEILIYDRALSPTDREIVEHYLISKYGIH